jgi:hypothetical protein
MKACKTLGLLLSSIEYKFCEVEKAQSNVEEKTLQKHDLYSEIMQDICHFQEWIAEVSSVCNVGQASYPQLPSVTLSSSVTLSYSFTLSYSQLLSYPQLLNYSQLPSYPQLLSGQDGQVGPISNHNKVGRQKECFTKYQKLNPL